MEEIGFPEELVVNSRVDRFQAYLRQHSQVFNDPLLKID
jgi:putative hydrolase